MQIYFKRFAVAGTLVSFLVLSSCSEEETPKAPVLLEATFFQPRTANELQTYINASVLDFDVSVLKYDVEIFKIKYKTQYKGEEIIASGFVILPKTTDQVGMLSFQHGTITAHKDAPTALALNDTELILYACLGSSGFIGVVPDYIGFGESKNILHPYYIEETTASSVIDNLKAAGEWAAKKGVNFNQKLFLAGYSQGGYATMATHKAIETEGLEGFNLQASFPASGGYHVKEMQEYFFDQQTYNQPHYLAYVAMSYQSYYSWTGILNDFFSEPYASRIPTLFNGILDSDEINDQLTDNISELIDLDLLENIETDPKYDYLVDAFNENSLLDWTPEIKMYMYHGDADKTVPYENSVSTYNHFIANGASSEIVTFTTLPGADHGSGIFPYIENLIPAIMDLK